jgi:hypothetical protein
VSRRTRAAFDARGRNAPVSPMQRALLPWESREDFDALHASFHREHAPEGATETGLVDQLVWLQWRRQRLMLGERAAHMAALQERVGTTYKAEETVKRARIAFEDEAESDELAQAIAIAAERDGDALIDTDADEALTRRAIAILETGDPAAYGEALNVLRQDTRDWWEDVVGHDDQSNPRSGEQLLQFLTEDVLGLFETTRGQIARRPAIRLQAHGESLDPWRMDKILALDDRLIRQFEKTLAMLLKLKELRLSANPKLAAQAV